MAIFKLTHQNITLKVRAPCLTCARNAAASEPGAEGPRAWRDGLQSDIELLRGPTGFDPNGPTQILERTEQ